MCHKRAVSPYQSARQPENEQTEQVRAMRKKQKTLQPGQSECGNVIHRAKQTSKQSCIWAHKHTSLQLYFQKDRSDHKKPYFKYMYRMRKFVLVLPPAGRPLSF